MTELEFRRRITITLTNEELTALKALAEHEHRDSRQQAAICVRESLQSRGLLMRLYEPLEPVVSQTNTRKGRSRVTVYIPGKEGDNEKAS